MVHLTWIYIKKLFIDKTPPNIHRWSTTVHLYKTIHMQYWLIIAAIVILQLFHCNDVPLVWWKKDHTKGVWFALILKVPRVFSRHQPALLSCHRYRKEYRNHDNQETWKNNFFYLVASIVLVDYQSRVPYAYRIGISKVDKYTPMKVCMTWIDSFRVCDIHLTHTMPQMRLLFAVEPYVSCVVSKQKKPKTDPCFFYTRVESREVFVIEQSIICLKKIKIVHVSMSNHDITNTMLCSHVIAFHVCRF